MFVTSTTYSGALGSLQAADSDCQTAALEAGHPGVFVAWLSDSTHDAIDRTSGVGPWFTTKGALVFASRADLHGAPRVQILDERGNTPQVSLVTGAWSGSDATGIATGEDCEGWTNAGADITATTGTTFVSDTDWGGGNTPLRCNAKAPLLCIQQ